MRYLVLAIFSAALAALTVNTTCAETPKRAEESVRRLAEAAALMNVCFESDAYDALPDETALKFHGLRIRIDALVEKLSNYYKDDALVLAYGVHYVRLSKEKEIIDYAKTHCRYCGERLFIDMEDYVSESEITGQKFIEGKAPTARFLAHPSWTEEEKENARYIVMSIKETQKATIISNKQKPFWILPSDSSDMVQMIQHTEQAYEYAKAVTDGVLDKANTELRSHWRGEYQEGLRLILKSWSDPDIQAQIKGQLLKNRFGDWWIKNKQQIRIPK